jgi:NAD(P)-dependent dehydrogenase (short-subunit alcohol dehydrogenase family)
LADQRTSESSTGRTAGRLAGRRALVTGAGRGIGRAVALALADAGADVVLVSRTESELRAVAAEIEAVGREPEVCVCDVTDKSQVDTRLATLPAPDILVNGAGGNRPQPLVDVDADTLDGLLALNVRSVFLVSRHVVRRLLAEGRRGVIVNISSQMGHVGAANRTVYCATKHAVEGFTKALAIELAPAGIRVVAVAPTYVETTMTAPYFQDPTFREEVLRSIPLGRLGVPADVGAAVVFLASDDASLITGTSLLVDGGWTAR